MVWSTSGRSQGGGNIKVFEIPAPKTLTDISKALNEYAVCILCQEFSPS